MKKIAHIIILISVVIFSSCDFAEKQNAPLVLLTYTSSVILPDTMAQNGTGILKINHWKYTDCDKFYGYETLDIDSGFFIRLYIASPIDDNCTVKLDTITTALDFPGIYSKIGYQRFYFSNSDSTFLVDSIYIK